MYDKSIEFELPKNNSFGCSDTAKVVDQLIVFCYTNNMLTKAACFLTSTLGTLKGTYYG
jgi:hypothetical protein